MHVTKTELWLVLQNGTVIRLQEVGQERNRSVEVGIGTSTGAVNTLQLLPAHYSPNSHMIQYLAQH